ncbi:MAG: DUF4338 domain-containing protein [Albidovulum sp.]|nr:DUF4338 domain-containing protein [Albidovulum sp.]
MLYAEISRARDRAELVTDDRVTLREQLEAATGERIAAPVAVVPVEDCDKHLACSMMATHLPEGAAACPGGRIRYWIASERYGRLGGLVFGAALWHRKARDRHIGRPQSARV